MKRLTINHIAAAGLRTGKKAYRSLALGILLSIFLITTVCLGVQGVYLARMEAVHARVGSQEGFLMDSTWTNEQMRELGIFDEIGCIFVPARVADTREFLGWYDETAEKMFHRTLTEGRMPEKPGEIALERSALEIMRLEAAVGEQITLDLLPVDGIAEKRTFTVVGVLTEQSFYQDATQYGGLASGVDGMPSILIHPEETFATGRTAVHRALTFRSPLGLYSMLALNNNDYERYMETMPDGWFYGTAPDGDIAAWESKVLVSLVEVMFFQVVPLIAMGLALLIAACVGISGAMEGQLARKTEEIAMLRAVGATRKQIRRIFGREAWIIALATAPAAIALSCLFVYAVSLVAPKAVIFRANPMLLVPVALVSVGAILISAGLPLRRAARIMPLQAMRDTRMLRLIRKIRPKKTFSAPRLIAGRQLLLRPTRAVGPALIMALLIAVISILAPLACYDTSGYLKNAADFSMQPFRLGGASSAFSDVVPRVSLSRADIDQIRALPMVERVETSRFMQVNVLYESREQIPEYYTNEIHANSDSAHLFDETKGVELFGNNTYKYACSAHAALQDVLETDKIILPMYLEVMPVDAEALKPYVASGEIDMEAINAGREVIVCAPDIYVWASESGGTYGSYVPPDPDGVSSYQTVTGDAFAAGQTLDLVQVWRHEGDYNVDYSDAAGLREFYSSLGRNAASPEIGAVIKDGMPIRRQYCVIVTTEEGAEKLGLEPGQMNRLGVYLDGDPDAEMEGYLTGRLESIAMRGDMEVRNNIEERRANAESHRTIVLTLVGMTVVLFAAAIGMISGHVTRQINADLRLIGTLRAVGANAKTIRSCYSGQFAVSIALGAGLGLALMVMILTPGRISGQSALSVALAVGLSAAFVLLTHIACRYLLSARIRSVTAKPIVENIREL